jgi:hypothetical protein
VFHYFFVAFIADFINFNILFIHFNGLFIAFNLALPLLCPDIGFSLYGRKNYVCR